MASDIMPISSSPPASFAFFIMSNRGETRNDADMSC